MSSPLKNRMSPEEYLSRERAAEYKSEYFAGEVFAMVGASEEHNLIVTNLIVELGSQLKKRPCKVYPSDMRVKVSPAGLYTYPDVVVVSGEARFEDKHSDTLLNLTLLVEVLSESTEGYDRGRKFEHYRKVESLLEYLLVSQSSYKIEQYVRQPENRWLFSEISDLQGVLQLPSVQCSLPLAEVYDKVKITTM
jgi:Uma2 family endonuclease